MPWGWFWYQMKALVSNFHYFVTGLPPLYSFPGKYRIQWSSFEAENFVFCFCLNYSSRVISYLECENSAKK